MTALGPLIHARLRREPERRLGRFLSKSGEVPLLAGELAARASAIARRLAQLDLPARSIIGVAQYSGPGLHAAWLACLWAGHLPSMIAPPSPRMEADKYTSGLDGMVRGLEVAALLVDSQTHAVLGDRLAGLAPVLVCDDLTGDQPLADVAVWDEDECTLVQHSSGTTSQQKAVGLTSRQVLDHQAAYGERIGLSETDAIISWLPLYHDMGFVTCFLQPLITGVEFLEMSPFAWAAEPSLLLRAIDAYRPTLCWMPNFAFSLLSEPRTLRGLEGLDLSSVRAFVNCSEPVMAASIERFVRALAPFGLAASSLTASYAMAENVFAVSQSQLGDDLRLTVDRRAMEEDGRIEAASGGEAVVLVSSGKALPSTEVQVRNPDGAVLGDGRIGEFFLRGTHLFSGYHHRPDLTAQCMDPQGWYATGDLGCLVEGELYVTGRKKDLIIIRGRNYRAQDMEDAVGALDGAKPGRVFAFSRPDTVAGTERLVILVEADGTEVEAGPLQLEIRKTIAQGFDTVVSEVRVVADRWLVKSTSGKLARADNRAKYLRQFGG